MRAIAKHHGINLKTVAKWRERASTVDLPTGPKERRSTALSVEEVAVVVAFRRYALLPLDDSLYALQPTILHLTRSSLHLCPQRHGIGRLPKAMAPRRRSSGAIRSATFTSTLPRCYTEQGKLHMFVAIDRTSKSVFVDLHEEATRRSRDFLLQLIAAASYRIQTVLTDNGIQFTTPGAGGSAVPFIKEAIANSERFWARAFEYASATMMSNTGPPRPGTRGPTGRLKG